MGVLKVTGIITRYANYRDYDRMVTIFTPEYGKIQAIVRGCRKTKSRLIAAGELFCYGDYMLYSRNQKYSVTQCEVKDSFYNLRMDIDVLANATLMLNLCDEVVNSNENNTRIFLLLLNSLTFLEYSDISPEDITSIFELKLMDCLGYKPYLNGCIKCGEKEIRKIFFSPVSGGTICENCGMNVYDSVQINRGTIESMRFILQSDFQKLKNFKLCKSTSSELQKILKSYLSVRIEKNFKSLDFIKNFNNRSDTNGK